MNNKISVEVPDSVAKTVNDAMETIQDALKPYLVALSDEERAGMLKVSDKTVAFVSKANEYANGSFKKIAEPFVDLAEYKKDTDAMELFNTMNNKISTLQRSMEDTAMLAGSEAFEASLLVYASLKMGIRNGTPGAQEAFNELAKRFIKRKGAAKTDPKA